MPRLSDPGYIDKVMRRLESIPPDAVPAWGELRTNTLFEHLIWAARASLGQTEQEVPRLDNFVTRRIVAPLVMRGIIKVPKNVKMPRRVGPVSLRCPGGLPEVRKALQDYVDALEQPGFRPAPHPAFGDIGPDGWDQIHYRHLEHHLLQFGV